MICISYDASVSDTLFHNPEKHRPNMSTLLHRISLLRAPPAVLGLPRTKLFDRLVLHQFSYILLSKASHSVIILFQGTLCEYHAVRGTRKNLVDFTLPKRNINAVMIYFPCVIYSTVCTLYITARVHVG